MTAWESCLGSVTISSLGSLNLFVIWFVRVPGVHLFVEVEIAPVCCAYLMTALCPKGRAETHWRVRGLRWAYDDVLGVVHRDDDPGGELDLLPGLLHVDEMDTVVLSGDVGLHRVLAVLGPDVALRSEDWSLRSWQGA